MLHLTIPETEQFDNATQEFVTLEAVQLEFEHSLVSLSKWESKWETPFLSSKDKTDEQTVDYIHMMCLTPGVTPEDLNRLTDSNLSEINRYITASMTATWFNEPKTDKSSTQAITAEIIYYWMVSLNIPFECENWHLNRLITLVKVINQKNAPEKKQKMGKQSLAAQRREMNAQRKAQLNTTG